MNKQKSCTIHIAHQVSHRTRFKVDKKHRTPQNLAKIKHTLESTDGVDQVHINQQTGSVTVHHGTDPEVSTKCHKVLSELMCECVEVAVEAMEPELGPFALILAKVLPSAAESGKGSMVMPIALLAIGIFGGFQIRALLPKLPIAKFWP